MRACLQARSRWRPVPRRTIRRPGRCLDETQQAEDGDCTNADLIAGGQAANQEGADTHGHQADDQRGLAAHAIAEVPKISEPSGRAMKATAKVSKLISSATVGLSFAEKKMCGK